MPHQVSAAALDLFAFGQREAEGRGLLLVDTKYEFGMDADGNILLVDEVRLQNFTHGEQPGRVKVICVSMALSCRTDDTHTALNTCAVVAL